MPGIDPRNFEFALSQIEDGNIFENFAQHFLSDISGYDFFPFRLKHNTYS